MIKKIISNNKIITSVSQTNISIQTEKFIFRNFNNKNRNEINKTIISSNNNNNNNNKLNNNNRTFFTINPQFQNKKYEIFQSLSTPRSLKDTYKILGDISLGSNFKAANIRISYFNQEKEKCDIRGVKLFGGNSNSENWIVIIGGRGPSQWNNISLSLYLATILSQKPLTNFDIIIFPVENPIPIPNDTHNNQKRQPIMMLENTITQHQSLNNSNFSSINQPQPLFDNYPKGKSNALNDWLMKSKREFTQLKIDSVNNNITTTSNKILPQHGGPFDIYESNMKNPIKIIKTIDDDNNNNNNNNNKNNSGYLNQGNQFLNNINDTPNYILNMKNLNFHPSFNIDQLQLFGLNISKQIEIIDNTFDSKTFSPIQF
ncbi:hypothetical protein ACTA71_004462 [Dictyostelium dimigraforme]